MTDYTMIIEAAITLIVTIVTVVVVPKVKTYLESKIDEQTLKDVLTWVEIAVKAAEQIYKESGMGEKKKAYVKKFLNNLGIDYDDKEIDAFIESKVLDLNEEKNKKEKGLVLIDESD